MQLDGTGNNVDLTAAQLRRSKRSRGGASAATAAQLADRRNYAAARQRRPTPSAATRRRLGAHRHDAEINLHTNGITLKADAEDEDMYAAIDAMADQIDRQARRHHGEATDHTAPRAGDVAEQPPGGSE